MCTTPACGVGLIAARGCRAMLGAWGPLPHSRCFISTAIRRTIRRSTSSMSKPSSSRSSIHDWTIRAHRHRNLFQILLDREGRRRDDLRSGDHCRSTRRARSWCRRRRRTAFAFRPQVTDGWVMSFTEDVAPRRSAIVAAKRWRGLRRWRSIRWCRCRARSRAAPDASRPSCTTKASSARDGYRLAMRGLLALIAVEVARHGGEPRARGDHADARPTPRSRRCASWSRSTSGKSASSGSMPASWR